MMLIIPFPTRIQQISVVSILSVQLRFPAGQEAVITATLPVHIY